MVHFSSQIFFTLFQVPRRTYVEAGRSVTRFNEITPLWQNFKVFGNFLQGLFSIWQNFEPAMTLF